MSTDYKLLSSRLESQFKSLTSELEQLKTSFHSFRRDPHDEVEEASEKCELELNLTLGKRIRDSLIEVVKALNKFKTGTYGLCEGCGQPIDLARLDILPQARFCLSCKVQDENRINNKLNFKTIKEVRNIEITHTLDLDMPDELVMFEEDEEVSERQLSS